MAVEDNSAGAGLTPVADAARQVEQLERERAERLARLEQTFTELSKLTHQINNPLTSMIGRAQLLTMMKSDDERTTKAMKVIEESSRRVADYVRELALLVKDARERELGS